MNHHHCQTCTCRLYVSIKSATHHLSKYGGATNTKVIFSMTMAAPRLLLPLVLLIVGICTTTLAYPILVQLEEGEHRCLRLLIPEMDDAHLIILPLPSEDDHVEDLVSMESWFIDQVYTMSQNRDESSPKNPIGKKLPNIDQMPDAIAQAMSHFLQQEGGNTHSPVIAKLTNDNEGTGHFAYSYKTKYFQPTVVNRIRHLNKKQKQDSERWEDDNMGGFELCLDNSEEEHTVQAIVATVMVQDKIFKKQNKKLFDKDQHLTPLEENLERSIEAAQNVLREMKYMEKREARMRQTAESINSRVRWFSYLSVSVLLAVTYIQVTYLKRYFRKKKLM